MKDASLIHQREIKRFLVFAALLLAMPARAEIDLKFSGLISSDIRYRLAGEPIDSPYPAQQQLLRYGFSRNDNLIKARLSLGVGDRVKAVGDVDLVLYGYSDAKDIDALTLHERIDPYRLEAHAAYLDIYQILPKLDLRIGRQVVVWGAADQFNPTSNLNTLDLSDPLLFGRALANNMVRFDWNPATDWNITAVWVPIFRPAELPRTAPLALHQFDRPAPLQEGPARDTLYRFAQLIPPSRLDALSWQPEPSLQNSQFALRASGRVLNQDVSLSFYQGRFGIPMPAATVNRPDGTAQVTLTWPRMRVLGADLSGTIAKLGGMGYWVEGAVIFPQPLEYALYNDYRDGSRSEVRFTDDGKIIYNPLAPAASWCTTDRVPACHPYAMAPSGFRPTVIPATPFLKLTLGGDISIGAHSYINVQYLHGFIDEFGAGVIARPPAVADGDPRTEQRIGDYLVAGCDLRMANDTLLFRLFGVVKLPSIDLEARKWDDYHFTAVLFPQLAWTVWEATELSLGAFVFLGDRSTKFGDPAAGASEIFTKAKFTF